MSRRAAQANLKVCDFYDKVTHRCLADGTSICPDPYVIEENECEAAERRKIHREE